MTALFLLLAPTIFWIVFFLRRDRFHPEPARLIITTFILGAASAFLAGILELVFSATASIPFFYIFFVIGPVEEFSKYLVLRYFVYPKKQFDELNDGILYASVAALGFATLENVFYMSHYGQSVMLLRGFFSILGHVAFTTYIGMGLIRKKMGNPGGVLLSFITASVLHSIYDFLLMSGNIILIILFFPFFFIMIRKYFRLSREMSLLSKSTATVEVTDEKL